MDKPMAVSVASQRNTLKGRDTKDRAPVTYNTGMNLKSMALKQPDTEDILRISFM